MTRSDINTARCEALFASGLQQSDAVTASAVAQAISRTVRRLGIGGCLSLIAQEFGDHPEAARDRMRWVRRLIEEVPAPPATPPDQMSPPCALLARARIHHAPALM